MAVQTDAIALERDCFNRLRERLYARQRVYYGDEARALFEKCVQERVAALNLGGVEEYVARVEKEANAEEMCNLPSLLFASGEGTQCRA